MAASVVPESLVEKVLGVSGGSRPPAAPAWVPPEAEHRASGGQAWSRSRSAVRGPPPADPLRGLGCPVASSESCVPIQAHPASA